MLFLINNINGLIILTVVGLKKSCDYLGIDYKEANYNIERNDPYLAGLVDTVLLYITMLEIEQNVTQNLNITSLLVN